MGIIKTHWGNVDGRDVQLFRIANSTGSFVELSNYGAIIASICVPDKSGKLGNVILGFNSLEDYRQDKCYIGSTIGRFANRIANARFSIDDTEYLLEANDGVNTNHSGASGFHNKVFEYREENDCLVFRYVSPDMDGGYPGNITFEVTYEWTDNNELRIVYKAWTDRKTVVNFTNHCYFNLTGKASKIFDHRLTVFADSLLAAGEDYIPTGKIIEAGQLSFQNDRIADRMTEIQSHIKGLNVCYALNGYEKNQERVAAILRESTSGRELSVYTTLPGLMLYTGGYLYSDVPGNHQVNYQPYEGLCLECQFYPNSPNQPEFPSTVLSPGELFHESITYKFNIL